jgi:hypothetical protein
LITARADAAADEARDSQAALEAVTAPEALNRYPVWLPAAKSTTRVGVKVTRSTSPGTWARVDSAIQ